MHWTHEMDIELAPLWGRPDLSVADISETLSRKWQSFVSRNSIISRANRKNFGPKPKVVKHQQIKKWAQEQLARRQAAKAPIIIPSNTCYCCGALKIPGKSYCYAHAYGDAYADQ